MPEPVTERETRLRALNRSYMETLSFVTHELKGPLAIIRNYVYLLRDPSLGPLNDRQEKAVLAIDRAGHRLVEMVHHYLNLSRIENGEFQPQPVRVMVRAEVLDPLMAVLEPELAAHSMRVINGIGPGQAVMADRQMIREVFENLLGNAIKYGRDGGEIRLSASRKHDTIEFSIWNQGQGIPDARIPELFQKFCRLDGTDMARQHKGTGLGLFLCRHIVELHGGLIEARSRAGEWAEFVFTLPGVDHAEKKVP